MLYASPLSTIRRTRRHCCSDIALAHHFSNAVKIGSADILLTATAFLLTHRTRAATIPHHTSFVSSSSVAALESSACHDSNHCRSTCDIIWSCATTIFLCIWVSFHPDVPYPTVTEWRVTAIRVLNMVVSFVVPELTVGVAAAEWWETRQHRSPFQGACYTCCSNHFQLIDH